MVISLFILCFASTLAFSSTNKEQQLEVLSDSISKKISSTNKIANFANYHKKGVFYVRKQTYFDQRSAG